MSKQTEITGERLTTSVLNENTLEHLHRYAIALELSTDKNVLDIACGEGYGTNLLATVAKKVTGVDIDKQVILEAKKKYKKNNIEFLNGDIINIPLNDNLFDLIICFETLEHVEEHASLITELKRVLTPAGILMISTPNKESYTDKTGYKNPFHKKELYKHEFEILLKHHFQNIDILEQTTTFASIIHTGKSSISKSFTGDFSKIETLQDLETGYFIAIVSDAFLPEIPSSNFKGGKVMKEAINEKEKIITSSITYKTGHFILFPFKMIKRFFQKLQA